MANVTRALGRDYVARVDSMRFGQSTRHGAIITSSSCRYTRPPETSYATFYWTPRRSLLWIKTIIKEAFALRRKIVVLEYTREIHSDVKTCRIFEVPRSTCYRSKKACATEEKKDWQERSRSPSRFRMNAAVHEDRRACQPTPPIAMRGMS